MRLTFFLVATALVLAVPLGDSLQNGIFVGQSTIETAHWRCAPATGARVAIHPSALGGELWAMNVEYVRAYPLDACGSGVGHSHWGATEMNTLVGSPEEGWTGADEIYGTKWDVVVGPVSHATPWSLHFVDESGWHSWWNGTADLVGASW